MRFRAVTTVGLCLWAVGVQVTEGLAVLGIAITFVGVGGQWRQLVPSASALVRDNAVLLAFVCWALLGPVLGGNTPTGTGFARTLDWLWVPLAALGVRSLSVEGRRRVAIVAGVTLLLSCVAAALQHYGLWPGAETFSGFRFTKLQFERVYEPAPNDPGRFMGGGLAFHRIRFSHVSVLFVAFASAAPAGKWQWPTRIAGVAGALSVLLFPLARAAAAAGLIGTAAGWVLSADRRKRALLAVGGLGVLALVLIASSSGLRARLANAFTAEGSGEREVLLASGVEAVKQHPLTGVGAGQFRPSKFAPDAPQSVLDNPGKAHNMFLSMAAEFGLPGALLFVALLAFEARRFFRAGRRGAAGVAVGLTFVLVCLVHDPLFHSEVSLALMLLLGAARAVAESATAAKQPGSEPGNHGSGASL